MDHKKFTGFGLFLFLVCFVVVLVARNITKPRVIVIQSYSPAFSWTKDIDVGIKRVLEKHAYNVRWHYMDTKRHPSEAFKLRAGETARKMIHSWKPDVIIAIDDNAQKLVSTAYLNDPQINIVFAGVNKTEQSYGFDQADNVTGMLERINYVATKDILEQVLPADRRRIKHISDNSVTSQGIHDEIEKFDWSPLQFLDSVQVDNFEDWKENILASQGEVDFLLLTHYHTLKKSKESKQIVNPKDVIAWTNEHSSTPGISFWGFYVEDGGMMAVALSPYEQGEFAANRAVDIIQGKSITELPVATNRLFLIYMRKSLIEEKLGDLRLPLVYEAFSKATQNYYE